MNNLKIPMICVVGPTASGKTSLSIKLAKIFDGEIVSADSMQIYKGMDIATAKPSKKEQDGVVHHMMDFLDINESFSVAQYCDMAHRIIKDIHSRNKMPILVGGTGLYVDSLIDNITFSQAESDDALRRELYKEYEEFGVDHLLEKLSEFDPNCAEKLSVEKNVKRIIRAIEIYKTTNSTMSEHNANSRAFESPYNVAKIGLRATDRQFLYDRINKRVDIMVENGLVDEAKEFLDKTLSHTSSMAIGHKELIPYFNGDSTLESCLENLKMQTRRYAKRQLTWFKRDESICWLDIDVLNENEILDTSTLFTKKVLFDE